tara:strand:- start:833 stop:1135 length:303 start_codon:yes stop_codon:yes gene_type:complete
MLSLGIKAVQAARAGYKANKARKKLTKAQKARAAKIKKANDKDRLKQDYKVKAKPKAKVKPTKTDKAILGGAAATSAAATGYAVKKDNARLAKKYKKKEK